MKNKVIIKIHQAWKEVKAYQKRWGTGKIDPKKHFDSYSDFRRSLIAKNLSGKGMSEGSFNKTLKNLRITKKSVAEIKELIRYNVPNSRARTEYKMLRKLEAQGKISKTGLKLKDLKGMTTREYADIIKNEIKNTYKDLVANGMKASEAKREIAHMYFGS